MPPASVRPDAAFNIDQLLDENPKARQGFEWGRAIIELGARIKQARKAADLSQQALAGRLSTNQAYISELERGTGAQGPTYMMLLKIADACATTVQTLTAAHEPETKEVPETARAWVIPSVTRATGQAGAGVPRPKTFHKPP
jgi:DNA-binding XRE family transcriptional regulator